MCLFSKLSADGADDPDRHPRNIANGIVHRLDTSGAKQLSLFAYSTTAPLQDVPTRDGVIEQLKLAGFMTPSYTLAASLDEISKDR